MLFNSYLYIFIFLPSIFLFYFLLQTKFNEKASINFLVLASYIFYAYWNPKFLSLLLISIYLNYFIGKKLSKQGNKNLLAIGVILNLSPLIFFKYFNFILENINSLVSLNLEHINTTLPLAISFFTFQQIAYLVHSYKGVTHEYNLSSYSLFVSFFPQLIAGPIVHHKEMIPQFSSSKNQRINSQNIRDGITIFTIGLFKKTVIADSFSKYVSNGFDFDTQLNFFESWVTSLSYTFQLYFDFSGYSDMAIGSALLFNIKIPINFNSPYKSRNIQEFWRNWHITLGRWLRDYIYIPLGGNRGKGYQSLLNILATCLIGGIWHGAGWNFFIWGLWHGIGLIIFQISSNFKLRLPMFVSIFVTFLYVHISWIFFRAPNIERAKDIISSMMGLKEFSWPPKLCNFFMDKALCVNSQWIYNIKGNEPTKYIMNLLIFATLISFFFPNSQKATSIFREKWYSAIIVGLMFSLAVLFISRESEFLYFQF